MLTQRTPFLYTQWGIWNSWTCQHQASWEVCVGRYNDLPEGDKAPCILDAQSPYSIVASSPLWSLALIPASYTQTQTDRYTDTSDVGENIWAGLTDGERRARLMVFEVCKKDKCKQICWKWDSSHTPIPPVLKQTDQTEHSEQLQGCLRGCKTDWLIVSHVITSAYVERTGSFKWAPNWSPNEVAASMSVAY